MTLSRMLAPLALAACLACGDDAISVAGSWNLTAFRSDGVNATSITGTMTFATGGVVTVVGSVVFPGEPADDISGTGTWSQSDEILTLTLAGETADWEVSGDADQITLQLLNDASASRLTLTRQ